MTLLSKLWIHGVEKSGSRAGNDKKRRWSRSARVASSIYRFYGKSECAISHHLKRVDRQSTGASPFLAPFFLFREKKLSRANREQTESKNSNPGDSIRRCSSNTLKCSTP